MLTIKSELKMLTEKSTMTYEVTPLQSKTRAHKEPNKTKSNSNVSSLVSMT